MNAYRILHFKGFGEDTRHRLGVASRVLAAAIGGYALTSALTTLLLALFMSAPDVQGRIAALKPGFLIGIPILLWVFHTRSAVRVWGWLALWTALASAACWWLLKGGAA